MAREIVNSNDFYEVNRGSIVTEFDRKVLYRLYQPLVGFGAISLYFTLLNEIEADLTTTKTSRPHSVIFEMMDCTNIEFLSFIKKLEGIGLIRTYLKEDGEKRLYVYCLYAPKSPREFFDYDLYVSLLKEKIATKDFDRLKMYFKDNSKVSRNYEEITASFNDIYETSNLEIVDEKNNLVGRNSLSPKYEFDYESFYLKLKSLQVDKRKITDEVKVIIENTAAVNNLFAYEMAEIIQQCFDYKGQLQLDKITKLGALKNKNKIQRNQVETTYQLSGNETLDEKITYFNSFHPLKYYEMLKGNQSLFPRETKIIQDFMRISNLNSGVINVILNHSYNKSEALSSAQLEYWGSMMQKNKIEDAYDALVFMDEQLAPKKAKVTKKTEKVIQNDLVRKDDDDVSEEEYERTLQKFLEMRKKNGKD